MNLNDDRDFIPTLKLLPFGGFEVDALLNQLRNGQRNRELHNDSSDFPVANTGVSSGWLQSKIMAG